jgi:hypothetical protein
VQEGENIVRGTKKHHEAQDVPFGEVFGRRVGLLVLECDCRARLILYHEAAERMGRVPLACGVCGERWRREEMRSLEEERRCYSWLKDFLERLEGKEGRQEYYARLGERVAPVVGRTKHTSSWGRGPSGPLPSVFVSSTA